MRYILCTNSNILMCSKNKRNTFPSFHGFFDVLVTTNNCMSEMLQKPHFTQDASENIILK